MSNLALLSIPWAQDPPCPDILHMLFAETSFDEASFDKISHNLSLKCIQRFGF